MEKRDILLIAHFCDYGQENSNNRFNYIAKLLYDSGYDVELVTSSFSHRDKKQRKKSDIKEYKTTLIYEPDYRKNVSFKRFFYSHYIMACNLKAYLKSRKKPNLIYCAVPSIDVAYVAKKYAKKNNIPFIIDVQDLWPEAFQMVLKIPILNSIIFAPIRKKVDSVYKAADAVVAVSKTYAERAMCNKKKYKEALIVYLGTDLQIYDQNAKKKMDIEKEKDCVWLGYCGTLGHSYDLTKVFNVLRVLAKRQVKKHRFIIMGDGPLREKYETLASKNDLPVTFTGKLKYDIMCATLNKCDICINPISSGAAQSIINKHADYAASGLPVLSTQCNREYKEIVDFFEMGINCDTCSEEEIADILEELFVNREMRERMGNNARKCAEELFDRGTSYVKIIELINQTVRDWRKDAGQECNQN